MLDECRKKVNSLGLETRTVLIQADVLEYEVPHGQFDIALVGFLISHLTERQEDEFFAALRRMLTPSGRFLVLDSAWSHERARVNQKVEEQERKLNDGSVFKIFKRYFDRDDMSRWQERHGARVRVEYFGAGLLAVSGTFGATPTNSRGRMRFGPMRSRFQPSHPTIARAAASHLYAPTLTEGFMTVDRYTKTVLTVIAVCLVWMAFGGATLITPVSAQDTQKVIIAGWADANGKVITPSAGVRAGSDAIPVWVTNK